MLKEYPMRVHYAHDGRVICIYRFCDAGIGTGQERIEFFNLAFPSDIADGDPVTITLDIRKGMN